MDTKATRLTDCIAESQMVEVAIEIFTSPRDPTRNPRTEVSRPEDFQQPMTATTAKMVARVRQRREWLVFVVDFVLVYKKQIFNG